MINYISSSSSSDSESDLSFPEGISDYRYSANGEVEFKVKWSNISTPMWEKSKQFKNEPKIITYFLKDAMIPPRKGAVDIGVQTEGVFEIQNPSRGVMAKEEELELQKESDPIFETPKAQPTKIVQIVQNDVYYYDSNAISQKMDAEQFSAEYPVLFSDFIMNRLKSKNHQ